MSAKSIGILLLLAVAAACFACGACEDEKSELQDQSYFFEGEDPEAVESETPAAPRCQCRGGTCVNNNSTGRVECQCPKGFAVYKRPGIFARETFCKECNCGDNQVGCTFNPNFLKDNKRCKCENGYGDKRGKCTACDCGEKQIGCSFRSDFFRVTKRCLCEKGYRDRGGKCTEVKKSFIDRLAPRE